MHATRHVALLTELKAVQICVAQHESEADRLAGQATEISGVSPRNNLIDRIAIDICGVVQSEAFKRHAIFVLNLDAHTTGGGGGEVDFQMLACKTYWPGHQLTAIHRRRDGSKTIELPGVAPQLARILCVVVFK